MLQVEKCLNLYVQEVQTLKNSNIAKEHAYRTPLETMLNSMISILATNITLKIVQEGRINEIVRLPAGSKNAQKKPDFIVYKETASLKALVGSVEAKDVSISLNNLNHLEQIKSYISFTPNILFTNYRDFYLISQVNGTPKVIKEISLLDENLNSKLNNETITAFIDVITAFYSEDAQHYISSQDQLAKILAKQTKDLKDSIITFCEQHKSDAFKTKICALHNEYKTIVSANEDFATFVDAYAQSFIYGLIISKLTYEQENKAIFILDDTSIYYIDDIFNEFASEYKVLYEFLQVGVDTRTIPNELKPVFISIAKTFNLINFSTILQDTNFNELVVHLYESYLKEYDTITRKNNGVYYTPTPIVNFIIKQADYLLQNNLQLQNGFSNEKVKVLDFATGTGSFLLSLYLHELNKVGSSNSQKDKLKHKILHDYYGFELMFAPYIVAHTNLKYNLKLNGLDVLSEPLPIYLTNSLDLKSGTIANLLPELQGNYEKSLKIKGDKNVIVVMGNPPYNSKSTNKDATMLEYLKDYKVGLNEKNPRLTDDYVKFIRLAEHKIEQTGYGMVAVITNNSFLDGVTHRIMRKHLLDTFDDIYIINLHGNSLIKEGDKNVFDITVGTAISIFVKHKNSKNQQAKVHYFSTLSNNLITREAKFNFLNSNNINTINWQSIELEAPYYFFVNKNFNKKDTAIYNSFWALVPRAKTDKAIFNEYSSGITTSRDSFTIHYNEKSLKTLKDSLAKLEVEEIRKQYKLPEDGRDWNIKDAKADLLNNYNPQKINYRPFDVRYTSLSNKFLGRSRYEIMQNFENKENLGLIIARHSSNNPSVKAYITENISDKHTTDAHNYLVPLYLYNNASHELNFEDSLEQKTPNFTKEFQEFLKTLNFKPSPEDIIHYIYGYMHQKHYRETYIEYLQQDFPRVPIITEKQEFYKFVGAGKKLAELHLMENIPQTTTIDYTIFVNNEKSDLQTLIKQNFIINKISYKEGELTLTDANNNYIIITGITGDVWNYEIGSYKVLDKWLKYRKKEQVILNENDIQHIINMAISIASTINIINNELI